MAQKTVTNNNVTFSSSIKEIGSYSGYFNGTNSYLSILDSADFDFGNGDFTVDFWFRTSSNTTQRFICKSTSGGSLNWLVYYYTGYGLVTYFTASDSTGYDTSPYLSATIYNGAWHHFAGVRSGDNLYTFFDGTLVGTKTGLGTKSQLANTDLLNIGRFPNGTGYVNGYMDELRISKGIARWTSNFTPPSDPYTTDSYTKLLLHLENNVTDDSVASGTTYNLSFSEGLTGSDSIADNIKRTFPEGLTGSDSLVKTIKRNFAESATVSDIINKIIGSHFNDSSTASDLLTQKILKYCIDSSTGSDSASIAIVKLLTFNDSATASESITTLKHIIKTFAETATASDVINYKITRNFHDSATGIDSLSKKILFNLSDSGTGIDSITLTKILPYFFNALLLIID